MREKDAERAAILEFDDGAGLSRAEAEQVAWDQMAARAEGLSW